MSLAIRNIVRDLRNCEPVGIDQPLFDAMDLGLTDGTVLTEKGRRCARVWFGPQAPVLQLIHGGAA